MSQKDGRCPFCGGLLDPSSLTCPSCGRDIFQSQIDDSEGYKIQSRPPSIALTPRNLVIGGVVLLLIVTAPIIVFLSLSKGGGNPPLSTTPIIKTIIVHDQSTPIPTTGPTSILTEVPTSTPSSTSSLALCPNSHPCIAYQEDGSNGWQGWALTSDWRIVANNKLLSNDGSAGSNQAGPSAIPPYSLPQGTQNFAIEAGITVPQGLSNAHVSITACGSTTPNGWQGYEGLISSGGSAQIFAGHDELGQTNFDPGPQSHTYRLEVRGNVITLFVDQGLVAQATDNKFLPCGRQIGIVSSQAVIHVSSFKVILL